MEIKTIDSYIDDRADEGAFRVHRDVFADPSLFDLEQRFIFDRTWNFLGLDSQIAKPHDFVTTHMGRTPVVLMRDAAGAIGAFVNACRHKGAIYTFNPNWKLQMDNGLDYYHLTSTHSSFMKVVRRREASKQGNQDARAFDWNKRSMPPPSTSDAGRISSRFLRGLRTLDADLAHRGPAIHSLALPEAQPRSLAHYPIILDEA